MASASRSPGSRSVPVDLRLFNWSAVLDVLRGTVDVLGHDPEYLDDYERTDVENVYRHVATSVETATEIGDDWRRVVAVDLTAAQLDVIAAALEACERSPARLDDLPETLPDLGSIARDVVVQHEARR